jgi:hypothetical protein
MVSAGKFNGPVPYENTVNYGMYIIIIQFDGKCRVHGAKGKSFVANADASGARYSKFDSFEEALKNVKEWATYVWTHNDQLYLIEEYGLDRNFVEKFLNYVWPTKKEA